MIVFTTLYDSNFQKLADLTHPNKVSYCNKHNYPLILKNDNFSKIPIGFEKAYLILDAFIKYPHCEWVFFSECDTFITNMNIKLENIIENERKHFVITTDFGGINAGSFFVRNSKEGIFFIQKMIEYINILPHEQDFIQRCYDSNNFNHIISIYSQYIFNSYDYRFYNEQSKLDKFNNRGEWNDNDFILHLAGISLENRILIINEFMKK
jgi:mannan polymerase II complex MNN10 subunit